MFSLRWLLRPGIGIVFMYLNMNTIIVSYKVVKHKSLTIVKRLRAPIAPTKHTAAVQERRVSAEFYVLQNVLRIIYMQHIVKPHSAAHPTSTLTEMAALTHPPATERRHPLPAS